MKAETGAFGPATVPAIAGMIPGLFRPTATADVQIYHIKTPRTPQFRFEWHPSKKTVYVIRVGIQPEIADPIAENAEDHGRAQMAVLVWLRGYRTAKAELAPRKVG